MPRTSKFSLDQQKQVKMELWNGVPGSDVAKAHGLSQQQVSYIKSGSNWADVPWPDGSTGPMPEYLRQAQASAKKRTSNTGSYGAIYHDSDKAYLVEMRNIPGGFEKLRAAATAHGFATIHEYQESFKKEPPPIEVKPSAPCTHPDSGKPWEPIEKPHEARIDPAITAKLDWNEVLHTCADIPIVQLAETDQDEKLKAAIAIAFVSLTPTARRSDQAISIIQDIQRKLVWENEDA